MIETVFALILTLNGNMIEHVYKNSLSDCLKSKRIAQNEVNPERVVFTCKKVKAQTEIYMDRKKIVKILPYMEPFIPVNTIIAFILLCVVIYVGLNDNNKL